VKVLGGWFEEKKRIMTSKNPKGKNPKKKKKKKRVAALAAAVG